MIIILPLLALLMADLPVSDAIGSLRAGVYDAVLSRCQQRPRPHRPRSSLKVIHTSKIFAHSAGHPVSPANARTQVRTVP